MTRIFAAFLLLAACDAPTPDPATTQDPATEQPTAAEPATPAASSKTEIAAAVANELQAPGADTDAVLARHDLTADTFEQLMFEIAADPELTAAYQAARRK